jgi:hypothetical protein
MIVKLRTLSCTSSFQRPTCPPDRYVLSIPSAMTDAGDRGLEVLICFSRFAHFQEDSPRAVLQRGDASDDPSTVDRPTQRAHCERQRARDPHKREPFLHRQLLLIRLIAACLTPRLAYVAGPRPKALASPTIRSSRNRVPTLIPIIPQAPVLPVQALRLRLEQGGTRGA